MKFSPSLDIASQRLARGNTYKGYATDLKNVEYAKKQGYTYNAGTPTTTSAPMEVQPTIGASPSDSVSQILSGLAVATARQKKNTASPSDLANIAYAQKTYGFDPATMTLKKPPSTKTPIPADKIGQGDPYKELTDILGSSVTADMVSPEIAGLLALQAQTGKETAQYDELTNQLTSLMGQQGNKGADMQAELNKQGVPDTVNHIKELNLRAAQLQGEIQKFDAETGQISSDINQQAIPTGLLQGQQAQLQQQRDLTRNSKTAEMAATISLSQAYNQNLTLAQSLAEQAISLKYQPIENQLAVLEKQIGFASEKMSAADKKRANVISSIIEERKTKVADAKKFDSDISELAINAASNGAPLTVVNAMKKAKSVEEAAVIGQKYAKAPKTSGSGNTQTTGADKYVNVTKTTDAGGGFSFFGKNTKTGKVEPIGAGVYALKQGVPLDSILSTSKNPADKALIEEIKQARKQGDSDEQILTDMRNSGHFNHLFVGLE